MDIGSILGTPPAVPQAPAVELPATAQPTPSEPPSVASLLTPSAMPGTAPTVPQITHRSFGDSIGTRKAIYDSVLNAARAFAPATNNQYTLGLQNVDYDGRDNFTKAEQKKAILSGATLGRSLRGDWVLTDPTGAEVSRKRALLARVPHMTERGTFIVNGSEYSLANQMRLRPGIYTRQQENGEISAHVNVKSGRAHKLFLDPATGIFRIKIGQARIPLLPLLKTMGVTDKQIRENWGDLAAVNQQKSDPQALKKLYERVRSTGTETDPEAQSKSVAEAFLQMELDPDVTKRTLGQPFTRVGPDSILATTKKLLAVSRGEQEPDDRDSMAYQNLMGPEDLFAERIQKAKNIARNLLWKSTARRGIDHIPAGVLTNALQSTLTMSGLGQALEEINTAEILDHQSRVTRRGEGGIQDASAIPMESRSVNPSQLGLIDYLRTPESLSAGIDVRLARNAMKGSDGRLYTKVINAKSGLTETKSANDIADGTLAFSGELQSGKQYVSAMQNGKLRTVPRESVDFELPDTESSFSPLGNLIPYKSMVKGQRSVMGSRFLTQALPLENAEAPYVQSGIPGQVDRSFEQEYGNHMGALRSTQGGVVTNVTPDAVEVRYEDGTKETHELYVNHPMNRKTFIHQTPTVRPGQTFKQGDLLARSNYTDHEGTTALGMNARVAYLPDEGYNYEDAISISESFARRMRSQHAYQHQHEWEPGDHQGKKAFISMFPSQYTKKQLDKFDDSGVVKPGETLHFGDPMILIASERERNKKSLVRSRTSFSDKSITWEHHSPGIVTDVVQTAKGPAVVVKAFSEMQAADKLAGRVGDKGIISRIIPDDQMPVGEDGKPMEVLLNPLGLTSRTNPMQMLEAALGKIAAKTGKPFRMPDFQNQDDLTEFGLAKLKEHGMSPTETLTLADGRKVKSVPVGNRWFMKLHHMADDKIQGRGLGAYDAEGAPQKGGQDSGKAKRVGMLEQNALLSHGAFAVMDGDMRVRGQSSPEYWARYMSGYKPETPKVPFVYNKFVNQLRASGINVVRQGERSHIMAMTNKSVDELVGDRELKNAETVNWKNMEPIRGGLFDPTMTGGHGGTSGGGNMWSFIRLHQPLPNPVMEEPIRHILGLTQKKLQDVIGGKEQLNGKTGAAAIGAALANINLPRALENARADIKSGKKTLRDKAVRRLGYLKTCERLGTHPKDWMMDKVPVLPPAFRPVSVMGAKKLPLVADPNYLYKDLFQLNQMHKELADQLDPDALGDEQAAVYNAFKAVTGLGDPVGIKNQERGVKGILKSVFGSSPKYGVMNRKLLSSTVDMVGRGVIAPDPNLTLDETGIPETAAWDVFGPSVVRRMVRAGVSRQKAVQSVKDQLPAAKQYLQKEMDEGVVILSRAPTLHRYGTMAFRPKLIKGAAIKMNPLVNKGFGADYDGDQMNFRALTTDEEKQEALQKMLPSMNLFSTANFKADMNIPSQEYVAGLYQASKNSDTETPPAVFATAADAIRAFRSGKLGFDRRVQILES